MFHHRPLPRLLGPLVLACIQGAIPSIAQTSSTPVKGPTELVLNGGFEQSGTAWTLSGEAGVAAASPVHGGASTAWLLGNGTNGTGKLQQSITIPAGATVATLSFWTYTWSTDTSGRVCGQLDAVVIDGTTRKRLGRWNDLGTNTNGAFMKRSFDVSAYKGKTITVSFEGTEWASSTGGAAGFHVDDVSLVADVANTAAPTLTSFTPASGPVGTAVTLTGTGFTGTTSVKFNGTTATFTVRSATQITTTVPTGATNGPITVTTPGGTATSTTSYVVNATAPTLSSFTPASGGVGTSVTLTGTNFTGANSVKFNGTTATFTVRSATQITTTVPTGATNGPITVTTPNGTATSATSYNVNVTTAPTITSFTPTSGQSGTSVVLTGTNFTGATAVTFNNVAATFTVNSATKITATAPSNVSTGPLRVTTPGGTATSTTNFTATVGADTLSISKIEVGQATQRANNSMRLAQDKRAYLRVFMKAAAANSYSPTVLAQFFLNGVQTYQTTINRPTGLTGVPTAVPGEGEFEKTWNAIIPANILKPGLSVKVTADPNNLVTDGNRANNVYPATGNLSLDVRNTYPYRTTLVPLGVNYGGTYYTASVSNPADYTVMFQRIWPVPENLDTQIHSTYYTSTVPLADYSSGWEDILNELGALQVAEGTSKRYYYGVYSPYYGTAGGSGMSWLGAPQSMGVDWSMMSSTFTWAAGTYAHEVGHALNREHSPCGGAGGPDPSFPYADGSIGTWGYDCWTDEWYSPTLFYDVMGYCGYSWVSDYSVDKVMDFRLSGDPTVPGPVGPGAPGAVPCHLVWGKIVDGEVVMNPTFTLLAEPTPEAKEGSYRAELVSASGQVLGTASFEANQTAHGRPNVRGFVLAVPVQASASKAQAGPGEPASVASIRISRNAEVLPHAARSARSASARKEASQPLSAYRTGPNTRILWDGQTYPMIMVKNQKGEVIAFGRNGELNLPIQDANLEIHLSNGGSSHAEQVAVR